MTSRPRGDDGTVLVLVLGLFGVLLLLVALVVDVSVVVLAKRSVASAADGAAVSAAQAIDDAAFYGRGLQDRVPLSEQDVAQRVAAYEAQAASDQPGLQLSSGVDGGTTAVVVARRTVALPVVGRFGIEDVEVVAEARARAPLLP